MRNRLVALTTAAAVIAAAACGSDSTTPTVSKIVNFTATMIPSGEVGANLIGSPSGSGSFIATLDTSTNLFTWSFTFTGLTSNVNNGHIHGPFPAGAANSASVILNFNPASPPPGASNVTFTGFGSATVGSGGGSIVLSGPQIIGAGVSADSLRKLLLSGNVYVNIHTTSNPGGEIRAQITKK
jgi:hypothetical protein